MSEDRMMKDPDSEEQLRRMAKLAESINQLFADDDTHPTTALRALAICAASIVAVQSGSASNAKNNKAVFHEMFDEYITPVEDGGCLVFAGDEGTAH